MESIDFAATIVEYAGGAVPDHIIEGRSLRPLIRGEMPENWRKFVVSEYDYGPTPMATALNIAPRDSRLVMICDGRWKYIHAEGFRPMLFDLRDDPQEFNDLGASPEHQAICDLMAERLSQWARRPSQRTTRSEQQLASMREGSFGTGIIIGVASEDDVPDVIRDEYSGHPGRVSD